MALLKKLLKGLTRTKQRFVGGLKTLLAGRTVDAELLGELEAVLIQADIGVQTATRICEDLQVAHRDILIAKGDDVIAFL